MSKLQKLAAAAVALMMLLVPLSLPVRAAGGTGGGSLYVNGTAFDGSFQQAVEAAMPGGTVEIEGRVFTRPVGWTNSITVDNVTIQGRGRGAVLALEPFYFADYGNKCDVLTIQGNDVTVKNLTINAGLRVDFPLRVFGSGILIEDVTCVGGLRGAVNVLGVNTGKTQTYRNVKANSSVQGGFYLDNDDDCAGLVFEKCTTEGNLRVGVLVRNSYSAVVGVDLSGITCKEGVWAIEDRETTIGGAPRADVKIVAGPRDANGQTIDLSRARYIPFIENSSYRHYRFGIPESQCNGAALREETDIYGFPTTLLSSAPPQNLLGLVGDFLSYGLYTAWQALKIWLPAVYA